MRVWIAGSGDSAREVAALVARDRHLARGDAQQHQVWVRVEDGPANSEIDLDGRDHPLFRALAHQIGLCAATGRVRLLIGAGEIHVSTGVLVRVPSGPPRLTRSVERGIFRGLVEYRLALVEQRPLRDPSLWLRLTEWWAARREP